jgi:hypothetical protein
MQPQAGSRDRSADGCRWPGLRLKKLAACAIIRINVQISTRVRSHALFRFQCAPETERHHHGKQSAYFAINRRARTMSGGFSPLRLLLPLAWMALAAILMPLMLGLLIPFFFVVWLIALPLVFASEALQDAIKVSRLGYVMWALWWPALILSAFVPTFALTLAAVLYLDAQAASPQQALAAFGLPLPETALLCVVAGILGVSVTLVFAFIDIPWRLKQIRQVRTLPRSRARSAAVGLGEFEGIARAAGADRDITKSGAKTALPFYLDDGSGRILVDPQGAAVRERMLAGASMQLNEIEEGIRDGDRVYVIGNVQTRDSIAHDALESERLVIKPLKQRLVASPVGRLLFPERHQPADRDAPNIFIVDKGSEHGVTLRLRLVLWDYCVYAAIYLAASFWLVQAAWPWLAPLGHYRDALLGLFD